VRNPKGTGAGIDWVQDGDTAEEKAKRDADPTNDPDSLTPVFPDESDPGESWQPGDDPDALTPPFTPIVIDPGESWEPPAEAAPPVEDPGESWEPTPNDPGGVVRPPISGEQTYTAEELEAIRRAGPPSPPISR